MSTRIEPLSRISHRATETLIREIGIVDTIRFLNQFRTGQGDYTAERRELFRDVTLESILGEINTQAKSD